MAALHERFPYVAIRLADGRLVSAGRKVDGTEAPVEFQGRKVAELELSTGDPVFARRVASLISPFCRPSGS